MPKKMVLYETLTGSGNTVEFPIFELSTGVIAPTSDTTQNTYYYEQGTPIPCPVNQNLYWAGPDLHTVFADWENMPHKSTDQGCVIRSDAVWGNDSGTYRPLDSPFVAQTIGVKPADWDDEWMYYGTCFNGTNDGKTYQIYVPLWYLTATFSGLTPVWGSGTQYYKNDPSDHDYRLARVFCTKAGFNFGLSSLNLNTTYWGTLSRRAETAPFSTDGNATQNFPYAAAKVIAADDYHYYAATGSSVSAGTILGYMDTDDIPAGGINVYHNQIFIFVHFEYNGTDFYGYALLNMSDATDAAVPTIVRVCGFDADFWGDSVQEGEPEEPGNWGADAEPAGGDGSFTAPSDNVLDTYDIVSDLNTNIGRAFAGAMLRTYRVGGYAAGVQQFNDLAQVLFSTGFMDRYVQSKYNPQSSIIALHLVPYQFCPYNATPAMRQLRAGGYDIGAHMPAGEEQAEVVDPFTEVSFAAVDIGGYFGAYPDFAPYTKITLHLPYIGCIDINPNYVMRGKIAVKYLCDLTNGNIMAWVHCTNFAGNSQYVYTATGNCAYSIPIFSESQSGAGLGKVVMSAVAGAASLAMGNVAGVVGAAGSIAGATLGASHVGQISGNLAGNVGALGSEYCYLDIERPVWSNPHDYPQLAGLPLNMSGTISGLGLSGLIRVSAIETDGITATEAEIAEIERLLRSGVWYEPPAPEP